MSQEIFDAASSDPDEANRKLEATLIQPPLQLSTPDPSTIKLTSGFLDEGGELQMEARVRELNGEDEEYLAREFLKGAMSVSKFVDVILRRNVLTLGEIDKPSVSELRSLLIGDRLALSIGIRCLTYGDDWPVEGIICKLCGKPFDVVIELKDDIKWRPHKNPSQREFPVDLRNGSQAIVRFITGEDELAAVGLGIDATEAEQTTVYLDRCILTIDGKPAQNMGKSLGAMDRRKVMDELKQQPGPILEEVSVPCSNCERSANYPLNVADLFRF